MTAYRRALVGGATAILRALEKSVAELSIEVRALRRALKAQGVATIEPFDPPMPPMVPMGLFLAEETPIGQQIHGSAFVALRTALMARGWQLHSLARTTGGYDAEYSVAYTGDAPPDGGVRGLVSAPTVAGLWNKVHELEDISTDGGG